MDYARELLCLPIVGGEVVEDGLIEFEFDLFRGTPHELAVCAYSPSTETMVRDVLPVLVGVLKQLDAMVKQIPTVDADLAVVTLWKGRIGLTFWERGVNNEFVAMFAIKPHDSNNWFFTGFGDLFSMP